jgi:hypothetical protein
MRAYIGLDAPIEVVVRQSGVLVEKATVPTAHVAVRQHPPLAHSDHAEPVETVHVAFLVNPLWRVPVLWRHDFVVAGRLCQV